MAFKIPYTFIPGTKAKANEVNSNFSSVADFVTEINTNLSTTALDLETTKTNLADTKKLFEENRTKFSVNSSTNTLITTSGTTIYFNSEFEITNHKGISAKILALPSINCQSLANGTYNIFAGVDSTNEYFLNAIYKQKTEPATKNVNDIWLNTSKEPIFVGKWNGATWVEYTKVPIGNFTITDGSITSTTSFPFNQNGYNTNSNSTSITELSCLNQTGKNTLTNLVMPDLERKTLKSTNTVYQAETDGYVTVYGYLGEAGYIFAYYGLTSNNVNGALVMTQRNGQGNTGVACGIAPIPKETYYRFVTSNASSLSLGFIPVKGAN